MYPYWNNDEHWRKMSENMNYMQKIMNNFLKDTQVKNRLENHTTIHAKIKFGGKTYKIVMEEVLPEEPKMEIEFEDEPPEKHPDFTE